MRRQPRTSAAVALTAALVLAACADPGRGAIASAPLLAATPTLRIGSVDDPATALTWIRGMVVDDEGRIYSGHPQESVILVHDSTGARVGRLGGPGDGPGELRAVGALGLRGDSLWVLDHRQYRITWFAPDGRVLRSVRIPVDPGTDRVHSPPRPDGVLADGRLHGAPPAWSRAVASGELTEQPVVVMDSAGATGDTLFVRPLTIWAVRDPAGTAPFGSYRPQPFDDAAIHALSPAAPEYVVVRRKVRPEGPATFRVARVAFSGDTLASRSFAYDPVPIDPAVPDSLVEAWARTFEDPRYPGAPTPAKAAEWARASLYVPAHHPPVSGLVIGRDGTLWMRREEGGAGPGVVEWLALDPALEPIGRVRLPARLRVEAAERDRVWGWEMDELDVPYIVRYAVGAGGDA